MVPFQIATFTSAFLLFLVQPLIAKHILPWFGGAPAVWSTSLVFFQLALVVGYGYAHLTRRLGVTRQAVLHVGLLVVACLWLPIVPSPDLKPIGADVPGARVLQVLATTVGVPYVLLSATAPMLQDWFARGQPGVAPYGLYALSNAGSLLALLAFPIWVERHLDGGAQAVVWSAGFALFVVICGWCAWVTLRPSGHARSEQAFSSHPASAASSVETVLWVALSATGTGLLLAITNQLCQEVATAPLLWVLPLALYLISFILCFADLYSRRVWLPAFVAALALAAYVLVGAAFTGLLVQAFSLLVLLMAGCMVCHGELAHLRPPAGHLTRFYLALSLGGAAGGLFVALIAPQVFTVYAELPLFVLMTVGLFAAVLVRDRWRGATRSPPVFVVALPLACFLVASILGFRHIGVSPGTVAAARNFYGILRVVDHSTAAGDTRRGLYHGRVLHGAQFLDAARRRDLTTDFAAGSGIDLAFRLHPRRLAGAPMRIGVVGLGAGAIAAFGQPGDSMRFFELNPQVIEFARTYFTYLSDSPAVIDVVEGDARLSLETELRRPQSRHVYDLFIVDAFAGASIPVHLLTQESFALYRQALAPEGVLAVHVSNQHLDLTGVVRGSARRIGLSTAHVTRDPDVQAGVTRSEWMIATHDQELLDQVQAAAHSRPSNTPPMVWTDAFSSLTSVLR